MTALSIVLDEKICYWYRATVRRIYDGDTIHVDIVLGLNITSGHQKIRLSRINAPELKGRSRAKGTAAKNALVALIPPGTEVLLNTKRDGKGKYGRWLAEIWRLDPVSGVWSNINEAMVNSGNAVWMEGDEPDEDE